MSLDEVSFSVGPMIYGPKDGSGRIKKKNIYHLFLDVLAAVKSLLYDIFRHIFVLLSMPHNTARSDIKLKAQNNRDF